MKFQPLVVKCKHTYPKEKEDILDQLLKSKRKSTGQAYKNYKDTESGYILRRQK